MKVEEDLAQNLNLLLDALEWVFNRGFCEYANTKILHADPNLIGNIIKF